MSDLLFSGFTRKETLALTKCTSSRLAYLEKAELIVPQRIRSGGRRLVLFSLEQLFAICAIKDLRKSMSPKRVRSIVDFIAENEYRNDMDIVVINDQVYWTDSSLNNIPELINKQSTESIYWEIIFIPILKHIASNISEEIITLHDKNDRIQIRKHYLHKYLELKSKKKTKVRVRRARLK